MPTITQKAVLDLVGMDTAGTGQIQLRWRKLTLLDGEQVAMEYHRSPMIEADDDVAAIYAAQRQGLVDLGFPEENGDEGLALANAVATLRQTPARVADARQRREEARRVEEERALLEAEREEAARLQQEQAASEAREALKAEILTEITAERSELQARA